MRQKLSQIEDAVDAVANSKHLKLFFATVVETLSFLRSGTKNGKQLHNPYPAVKFDFIVDPGVKGLSTFGMENPLIKLEYERKQTPPPGVFDFVVQHCAQSCEPAADGDGVGGLARTQSSLLEAEQEGFAGMLEDELGPVLSAPSFGVRSHFLIFCLRQEVGISSVIIIYCICMYYVSYITSV
eukprot:COSAG06_NODE_13520_length_1249_cov_1.144348_2_plen_183_part_00